MWRRKVSEILVFGLYVDDSIFTKSNEKIVQESKIYIVKYECFRFLKHSPCMKTTHMQDGVFNSQKLDVGSFPCKK